MSSDRTVLVDFDAPLSVIREQLAAANRAEGREVPAAVALAEGGFEPSFDAVPLGQRVTWYRERILDEERRALGFDPLSEVDEVGT